MMGSHKSLTLYLLFSCLIKEQGKECQKNYALEQAKRGKKIIIEKDDVIKSTREGREST